MVSQNDLFGGGFAFDIPSLESTELGQRTIFEAQRPDFLKTQLQRRLYSSLFDQTLNDFLSRAGQDIFETGQPQQSFTDFVTSRDVGRQFRRQTTGMPQSPLVSAARFLFNR